jgi:hypothetical protein
MVSTTRRDPKPVNNEIKGLAISFDLPSFQYTWSAYPARVRPVLYAYHWCLAFKVFAELIEIGWKDALLKPEPKRKRNSIDGKAQPVQRSGATRGTSKIATKALLWTTVIVEVFILTGSGAG